MYSRRKRTKLFFYETAYSILKEFKAKSKMSSYSTRQFSQKMFGNVTAFKAKKLS